MATIRTLNQRFKFQPLQALGRNPLFLYIFLSLVAQLLADSGWRRKAVAGCFCFFLAREEPSKVLSFLIAISHVAALLDHRRIAR